MLVVQYICLFYSFVSFLLMVFFAFTADKDIDISAETIKAFGWPIHLIHWARFQYKNDTLDTYLLNTDIDIKRNKPMEQFMFKGLPKVDPLNFDIDEAVFFVKDEDLNNSVYTDPTAVGNNNQKEMS